jgi:hypothetical protein
VHRGAAPAARDVLHVGTDQQLVRAAEHVEGAAQVQVEQVLLVRSRRGGAAPQAGLAVHRDGAAVEAAFLVALLLGVGGVGAQRPPVGQPPGQLGEHLLRVDVAERPVGGQPAAARQADVGTVGVARHRGRCALGAHVLLARTQGEHCARSDVGLEHAVDQRVLALGVVDEVASVLVGDDGTAAHLAVEGQRPRRVEFGAVVVPAASRQRDAELRRGGGHLAHQVDGAAGVAGAVEQAGRAAKQLDAVVLGEVVGGVAVEGGRRRHRRAAVELDAVDLEAARVDLLEAVFAVLHGDADGLLCRLADAGDVLVGQPLVGEHRNRLRQLAHRLRRLAHGDGLAGVRARAFGLAFAPGRHAHFTQRGDAAGEIVRRLLDRDGRAVDVRDQPAAGQQLVKCLARREPASHRGRPLAGQQGGRGHEGGAGLLRQRSQSLRKRLRRDGDFHRLGLRHHGVGGDKRQQGCQRQGRQGERGVRQQHRILLRNEPGHQEIDALLERTDRETKT